MNTLLMFQRVLHQMINNINCIRTKKRRIRVKSCWDNRAGKWRNVHFYINIENPSKYKLCPLKKCISSYHTSWSCCKTKNCSLSGKHYSSVAQLSPCWTAPPWPLIMHVIREVRTKKWSPAVVRATVNYASYTQTQHFAPKVPCPTLSVSR